MLTYGLWRIAAKFWKLEFLNFKYQFNKKHILSLKFIRMTTFRLSISHYQQNTVQK